MKHSYDICLDATNLNSKYFQQWIILADCYDYKIEYKKFDISLEEALERDKNREFPVGEQVIINFYNKYCNG
jgi:predicted kinase